MFPRVLIALTAASGTENRPGPTVNPWGHRKLSTALAASIKQNVSYILSMYHVELVVNLTIGQREHLIDLSAHILQCPWGLLAVRKRR